MNQNHCVNLTALQLWNLHQNFYQLYKNYPEALGVEIIGKMQNNKGKTLKQVPAVIKD